MRTGGIVILLLFVMVGGYAPAVAQTHREELQDIVERGLDRAVVQARLMAGELLPQEGRLPRTVDRDGKLITSDCHWWCCGFFPGELWYLYEYTRDPELKAMAEQFTGRVEKVKEMTHTHDIGFMLYCSYGNGLRITGRSAYKDVLIAGAKSLASRYHPKIGAIRSWDHNGSVWKFPVIIDNMMNLELLLFAGQAVHDRTMTDMALSHADVTLKNHFRSDYSTYHVVSYDPATGLPEVKQTAQGAADSSAWARGQAWALYGYTMMFRETGLQRYFDRAKQVALFLMDHPRMPVDKIPYWDFDAPGIPDVPRDASSAAIMASALLDLSRLDSSEFGQRCCDYAGQQLRSLTSPVYLADPGTNGGFVLKHSTGSFPGKSEVDVPLSYADYYYVEALMRLRELLKRE